mmetsp:Transcript_90265/g.264038  ORF Transcript_90265/g.264038 Transcript_90265/m.264038 type:complete len:142 (-) Transcript_90265:75-500(-)
MLLRQLPQEGLKDGRPRRLLLSHGRLARCSRPGHGRRALAAAAAALLAAPGERDAWAQLDPSTIKMQGDDADYNFAGASSLESRLSGKWDKVKPVCEERDLVINGGSRTMAESVIKRVVCDRADLKAEKAAKKAAADAAKK